MLDTSQCMLDVQRDSIAIGAGLVAGALLAYGADHAASESLARRALNEGEALSAPGFELPVLASGAGR